MADEVIDSLQIKVTADTKDAESKISKLSETLAKLKVGSLSKTAADKLKAISDAAKGVDGESANKVEKLASAISKLSAAKIPASLANQISKIGSALKFIDDGDIERLTKLTDSIEKINASGGVGNIKVQMPKVDKSMGEAQQANGGIDLGGAFESVKNGLTVPINAEVSPTFETFKNDVKMLTSSNLPVVFNAAVNEQFNEYMDWLKNTPKEQEYKVVFDVEARELGNVQTTIEHARTQFERLGEDFGDHRSFDFTFNIDTRPISIAKMAVESLIDSMRGSRIGSAFARVGTAVKSFGQSVAKAFSQAAASARNFLRSITRIATYRLIRSALKAITQGFREGIQNAYQFSKMNGGELAKSLDSIATSSLYLKNTLATLAAPLINSFAPVLKQVIELVARFINMINFGVAVLTGKDTWLKAKETPVEYAAATDKATKANKAFKASLLGIDEINRLDDNSSAGASGGVGGANYSDMFEEVPTFDSNATQDVIDEIKNKVAKLTEYLSVAALAVGAILTFTGANIPLGVALMAAGAVGLVKALKLDWETTNNKVDTVVNAITAIVGGALLAIGGILAFSGANVPLGIGLMAAGAITLGATIALHWGGITDNVKEVISDIALAVGAASFVIGSILTFSGANIPLGIGLMAAGAATMGAAIAANWNDIKEKMQGSLGAVAAVVSAATLAVGAVLAFTGANIPLGIGLMAVGAAGLGTVAALNWETIKEKLQGSLGGIVAAISGALLAVGAVLAFTGVALPLGIGMMVAGAAGLGTVVALNWETIKEKLQGSLGSVMAVISGALLVIGAILLFTGAGIPLGLGLMAAGAVGLGTAISANWDTITGAISTAFEKIKGFFSSIMQPIIDKWNAWKEDKKELVAELKAKIGEKWEELKTAWTNFKEETKTKWAEYKAKLGEKWEELKTAWNNFKEETKTKWAEYKAKIGEKWEEMKTAWANFKEETKERLAKYQTWVSDKWESLKESWNNIKEGTKELVAKLSASLETTKANIDEMWTKVKDWWGEKVLSIKAAFDILKSTVEGWWTNIKKWFNGGENKKRAVEVDAKNTTTKDDTTGWWTRIKDLFNGKDGKKLPVGGALKVTKDETKSWWTTIKEKFGGKDGKKLPVGASINTSSKNLSDAWAAIKNAWGTKTLGLHGNLTIDKTAFKGGGTTLTISSSGIQHGGGGGTFASGGFPTEGQMFIAREAGPEYVGTIGNRTAVANNDQIVEGISSGVYAANQEQNALLRQQNALLQQLLEKDNGGGGQVAVSTILTGVDRYNRRAGKTVMATA